ncbi:hypothetical protein QJQ45_004945 [Haematococcus lacustris]|nr:hypothetical protein QJQ45_004945 [Haematococcus lacustris]
MPGTRTCTQPVATEFAVLRKRYSPADLAFMGDAVWTGPGPALQQAVAPPPPGSPAAHYPLGGASAALMEPFVGGVRYGAEAEGGDPPSCCCFSPSQAELQLLHWAVQQQAGDERQRFKGNASRMASYRKATAFEALLGGLLLTQPGRLAQLLACLPAA